MTRREAFARLRGSLPAVSTAAGIILVIWAAHVWTIRAIARQVGTEMAAVCVASIDRHDSAVEAHASMRDRESSLQRPFRQTSEKLAEIDHRLDEMNARIVELRVIVERLQK